MNSVSYCRILIVNINKFEICSLVWTAITLLHQNNNISKKTVSYFHCKKPPAFPKGFSFCVLCCDYLVISKVFLLIDCLLILSGAFRPSATNSHWFALIYFCFKGTDLFIMSIKNIKQMSVFHIFDVKSLRFFYWTLHCHYHYENADNHCI